MAILTEEIAAARHPVDEILEAKETFGERAAERVIGFMGSWKFLGLQTLVILVWIATNVYLIFHFDPFPFILLNLAFSTQAAYAAPLILLASNRSDKINRLVRDHEARLVELEEKQNEEIWDLLQDIQEDIKFIAQRKGG